MWFRIVLTGGKLFNIPYHLTHHRLHAASAFNATGRQDREALLERYSGALLAKHPLTS
jgi:hypothetical protein